MLNEAIYRSPKWLRNYIDFEVNTGEDIKGKPSKRRQKKLEREKAKRKEEASVQEWLRRWKWIDWDEFRDFYRSSESVHHKRKFRGRLLYSEKNDVIKYYTSLEGSSKFIILDQFDKWKSDKKREEEEQKRIEKDLDDLKDSVIEDWKNARYNDKIKTPMRNGVVCVIYYFENGDIIDFEGKTLKFTKPNGYEAIYTMGLLHRTGWVQLFNLLVNKGGRRPSNKQRKSNSRYTSSGSKKKSDNPTRDKYDKLIDTITLREKQLKDMDENHPDYRSMKNELETSKRLAKKMKEKHKFEHLMIPQDFWLI